MAAVLVTLTEAKAQLNITLPALDPGDVLIQLKLNQAEAIILNKIGAAVDPLWVSPATVDGNVSAAILLTLTYLFEHRGDDLKTDQEFWAAIDRLLVRHTPSAIA